MKINVGQVDSGTRFVREAVKAGWVVVNEQGFAVTTNDETQPWSTYTIEQATCITLTTIEALNDVVQNNIVLCGARGSYEVVNGVSLGWHDNVVDVYTGNSDDTCVAMGLPDINKLISKLVVVKEI